MTFTGHTGTGNMRVEGLPFTSINANGIPAVSIRSNNIASPADTVIQGFVLNNTDQIVLESVAVSSGVGTALAMDAAGALNFGASYEVA
jgi:hypothetical protein